MADDKVTQVQSAPPEPTPGSLETTKSTVSASRRVRARLARRMTAQRSLVNPVLEPLVAVHREYYPKADLAILQRAYEIAAMASAAPGVNGKPMNMGIEVREVMSGPPID